MSSSEEIEEIEEIVFSTCEDFLPEIGDAFYDKLFHCVVFPLENIYDEILRDDYFGDIRKTILEKLKDQPNISDDLESKLEDKLGDIYREVLDELIGMHLIKMRERTIKYLETKFAQLSTEIEYQQ